MLVPKLGLHFWLVLCFLVGSVLCFASLWALSGLVGFMFIFSPLVAFAFLPVGLTWLFMVGGSLFILACACHFQGFAT